MSVFWQRFSEHQEKVAGRGDSYYLRWISEQCDSGHSLAASVLTSLLRDRIDADDEADIENMEIDELRKLAGEEVFVEVVKDYYEDHMDEIADKADVDESGDGVIVHRSLMIDDPAAFVMFLTGEHDSYMDHRSLGVCWSYDAERAEAHHGSGGVEVLLSAVLPYDSVDFDMTFSLWESLNCGRDEAEVRALKGSRVRLTGVRVGGRAITIDPQWHTC